MQYSITSTLPLHRRVKVEVMEYCCWVGLTPEIHKPGGNGPKIRKRMFGPAASIPLEAVRHSNSEVQGGML